ncbi:hypothetical protein ACFLQV_03485, partial [Calditrichota bacterium]
MKNSFLFLGLMCLIAFTLPVQGQAQFTVEPHGISTVSEDGDSTIFEIVLTNNADQEVMVELGFSGVDREQRGPRRDELEASWALLRDGGGWSDMSGLIGDVDGEWDIYTSGDFDEFDIDDYDCIWVAEYQSDAFNSAWNENLERFEDWVDAGGALYHGAGTNNWNVAPTHPGGLERIQNNEATMRCILEAEDNYWVELNDWEEGTEITSNSACHAAYNEDDLEDIENSDWYQVITVTAQAGNPEILTYGYGRGTVTVSGTTDSHMYANGPEDWSRNAMPNLLYYLEYLSKPAWIY